MRDEIDGAEDRLELDELFVRGFTAIGVIFWGVAAIAMYATGRVSAFWAMCIVAVGTALILAVGWASDRVAAALLGVAAGVLIGWGIIAGWEIGIWLLMGAFLIGPILVAAAMYLFAEREEEVLQDAGYTLPTHAVHA